MKELLYQKRSSKKILLIGLSTNDVKEDEKVSRLIEIQLNKHGWYILKW